MPHRSDRALPSWPRCSRCSWRRPRRRGCGSKGAAQQADVRAALAAASAALVSHDAVAWFRALPSEGKSAEHASWLTYSGLSRFPWAKVSAKAAPVDDVQGRYRVRFYGRLKGSDTSPLVCERILDFAWRQGRLKVVADRTEEWSPRDVLPRLQRPRRDGAPSPRRRRRALAEAAHVPHRRLRPAGTARGHPAAPRRECCSARDQDARLRVRLQRAGVEGLGLPPGQAHGRRRGRPADLRHQQPPRILEVVHARHGAARTGARLRRRLRRRQALLSAHRATDTPRLGLSCLRASGTGTR